MATNRVTSFAVMTDDRPWDDPGKMLSVDEALRRILLAFSPLPPVEELIDHTLGSVLATDIVATSNLPPFANSAMDGYALRAIDTLAASADAPAQLRIVGQAAAGYVPEARVQAGCAVRIMTGAPVPDGADAVVRFEETTEVDGTIGDALIGVRRRVRPGDNIRRAGEDARAGETLLNAGTRLRPAEIGLLAASGRNRVAVYRRPRVGVLVTGDEVVEPGEVLQQGQVWNSNGPMVTALIRQAGGEPVKLGIAGDTTGSVRAQLGQRSGVDLLITTGGVSVGDYDVIKDVLRSEGQIELWQVRLKPGKPLAFGWIGETPLIGLPGNPVAAAVAFSQFARPAILTMLGRQDIALPAVQARLLDRIENRGGRQHYVRVRVEVTAEGYLAHLAGEQGAGMLTSLAKANGLLVVPETCVLAEPGMSFPVQMTDWNLP